MVWVLFSGISTLRGGDVVGSSRTRCRVRVSMLKTDGTAMQGSSFPECMLRATRHVLGGAPLGPIATFYFRVLARREPEHVCFLDLGITPPAQNGDRCLEATLWDSLVIAVILSTLANRPLMVESAVNSNSGTHFHAHWSPRVTIICLEHLFF